MLVLTCENFAHAIECIYVGERLVRAKADDPGKSEGEPTVVAIRTLDVVEGDFHDDYGSNGSNVTVILDGVS
jgi:hypothetical protein